MLQLTDGHYKISRKEAEVEEAVLQARKKSHHRVRATTGKYDAENELEETMLELTALKKWSRASAEGFSKATSLLKDDISTKRQDLLAASPPFILALEQALVTVKSVDQDTSRGPLSERSRWKSNLKRLMKDVSDSIARFLQLPSRGDTSKDVDHELALAAASARLLSLHVNAWTTPELSQEIERIWLQAVRAEAKVDPQFQLVVSQWATACEALNSLASATRKAEIDAKLKQGAAETRMRDCQVRAGIEPKAGKPGRWRQRQMRVLQDEFRHIESRVAQLASPSGLAARCNHLLVRCAEAGAWTTAVSTYRLARSRGIVAQDPRKPRREACIPLSLDPLVFQHLLRAAKYASPPQPRAAMLVLREMRLRGESPSATHYNLVVSACARAAAVAASTSTLRLLAEANIERDDVPSEGNVRRGYANNVSDIDKCGEGNWGGAQQDRDAGNGDVVASEGIYLVSSKLEDGDHANDAQLQKVGSSLQDTPPVEHADHKLDSCLLFGGGQPRQFRGAETAGGAWRLALQVIADMRKRGVAPTEVTLQTLVECCRCAAAASSPKLTCDGREGKGSTPAEVYAELKEAGVPERFCYQAGLANALKGGRCFPEYIAELR